MHELLADHQSHDHVSKAHDARWRAEALATKMIARERWPRELMLEFQRHRLREMVQHAVANSPYYRDVVGELGDDPIDLQRLPVLTKTTLMAEFDRIVTDRRLRLADVEQHLAGGAAAEPMFGEYRIVGSGGTTGQRGVVVYDQAAWDVAVAGILRMMAIQEIPRDARVLGIGAPTPLHMTNRLFAELRARRRDAPRIAVTTPLSEMIEALNADQPDVMVTYPSVIRRLAEAQNDGRLRILPRQFTSVAETLTQDVRRLAADTWGAPVLNAYGSTEANFIGSECPWTSGIHVAEDLLVFEVVDEHNRPVPAGVAGHKVLVTNLFNRTLPFIRYELSDLVTVARGSCPCGRPHLRLASIEGRREDMLSLPARHGGRVKVHALLLGETLLHMPEVRQYQLSPRPDGLLVRVVLRDATQRGEVLLAVQAAIEAEFRRLDAIVETFAVEAVDEIKRVGNGAKERPVSALV
jgi:phenylacetate-CoA ligase